MMCYNKMYDVGYCEDILGRKGSVQAGERENLKREGNFGKIVQKSFMPRKHMQKQGLDASL